MTLLTTVTIAALLVPIAAQAQGTAPDEQDAQSKALDSTATQWSFQLSYQNMPDYYQDTLDDGSTRAAGSTDYIQLRAVVPIALVIEKMRKTVSSVAATPGARSPAARWQSS